MDAIGDGEATAPARAEEAAAGSGAGRTPTGRRWAARAATALAAIAVIAGTAAAILWQSGLWDTIAERIERWNERPVYYGMEHRSAIRFGPAAGSAGTVLRMRMAEESANMRGSLNATGPGMQHGALAREILRQAVLVAARDGLGATARDGLLGEDEAVAGEGPPELELVTIIGSAKPFIHFLLRRPGEAGTAGDFEHHLDLEGGQLHYYEALTREAEALSREQFPGLLRDAGLTPRPRAKPGDAPVPRSTQEQLSRMSFLAQFAAVRDLHASIASGGESPARLGALVRSYANLGFLTEHHWTTAHKAFKARALLYAQRMVAARPRDPAGLWHRAYAYALTGLHGSALDDLKAAGAGSGASPRPAWADLVEAFCRYDMARLEASAAAEGEHAQLAAVLRFVAIADPYTDAITVEAGRAAIARAPECFRVYDVLCEGGGINVQHVATAGALEAFGRALPARLRAMAGLPRAIAALLDDPADEPKLIRTLMELGAEDGPAEPSWNALGRMVREARFAQIGRRAFFMQNIWNVPTVGFVEAARPLIAGHPFRGYVDSFNPGRTRNGAHPLAQIPDNDFEYACITMIRARRRALRDDKEDQRLYWCAFNHMDPIAQDYTSTLVNGRKDGVPELHDHGGMSLYSGQMLEVSPHAPIAAAEQICANWGGAVPRIPAWEREHARHPLVLAALGRQSHRLGKADDARRYLGAYVKLSPDAWAYRELAGIFKEQGDLAGWESTLVAFLGTEEHGLDQAQVGVELAGYHMDRGEWGEALPFAERAAETGAEWAMRCASECNEGVEDWKRSELWIRRVSERYPGSRDAWLRWCQRTGRGDAASAAALADR